MMSRLPNWKKSRLVRVSRLVADLHRAPPKQYGSSFLLHTGFPTSLFDLFLKNRDRFNKPTTTPSDPQQQQLPPSMTDHRHEPTGAGGNNTNKKKKILFLGLFKVFLILGLALGAAQFAWVMAAAAFSLLSLELLGAQISGEKCNIEDQINKPVVGSSQQLPDKKITRTTDTTLVITDHHHHQPKSRPNLFKKLMKKKVRHGKKQIADDDHTQKSRENEDDKENESGRSANRNQMGKSCCYLNHSILMVMVIVLSGLIAGRIPALLVTVSCMVSHSQIRGFI